MKIGIFGVKEAEKSAFFSTKLTPHEVICYGVGLDENTIPPQIDFDIISVLTESAVGKRVIDTFPNLKMITVRATGFDNVDLAYAKQKGVTVCNVPSYGSHTVAEFAFGLILSLSRKIPQATQRVKGDGEFDYRGLKGFDLFDKTLGVIGTGRIGSNVIRIAQGFGMKVLAYDAHTNAQLSQELKFSYVSLNELLQTSDIVTIHIPATAETQHLINKDNIGLLKKTALLVNTSRGSIVQTEALLGAVESGSIGGAALDVLENEAELKEDSKNLLRNELEPWEIKNLLSEKILIENPNVIVTPHTAFYTTEAEQAILQTTVENIKGFINGQPKNIVN